ncbi:MAG: gliding motility protein [Myxococcaceae bacterium]|nr:gliding motility protein [Myxococcaceae bacterium]
MTAPAPTLDELEAGARAVDLLTPGNFATRFARGNLRHRDVMRLRELLERLSADLGSAAFGEWLDDLVYWLTSSRRLPEQRDGERAAEARLRTLFEAMEYLPRQVAALRAAVARLFTTSRAVSLFTDVGVPSRQGFFSEMLDRLSRSVLPDPPVEDELGELVTRLFQRPSTVAWFERLPPERVAALFELLAVPGGSDLEPLRRDMAEAAMLLAMRLAHHGLANDVRYRSPRVPLEQSPFHRLPEAVRAAVNGAGPGDVAREVLAQCRALTREVEGSLERTGVSVDLVYRLDLMRRQLDRLYALLGLRAPPGGTAAEGAGQRLLLTLVRGALRDRSVADLFRASTRLLARRVVDAAAHSGGHYVTKSSKELHQLFDSAAGGGFVTSFTALFKFLFSWAGLAPFWQGFFFSLNYAGSFITMQLLGFTLASKQPSMTAAHLARAMDESPGDEGAALEPLAHEVARAFRSQLAATLGNLTVIVPTVVAIDFALRFFFGRPLLEADYADQVVAGYHPFLTGLLPGAAATGVALWLASIAAGTLENWAVYRRLPQALASHSGLRAVLGPERARRLSLWLLKHVAGFGGNVALAGQMGLVPALAGFFGVPLQLHHVSVATGQLAFAGSARGSDGVLLADFGWACLGIALVGFLNFTVSFTLALAVALRSREAGTVKLFAVARAVLTLLWRRPADFFRTPAGDDAPEPS